VTAQELRAEIRAQAQREAESIVREAETEARRMGAEAEAEARTRLRGAERQLDKLTDAVEQIDRRRARFLKEFRQLLQRELDVVAVEEGRQPLEERTIELDLGARKAEEAPSPADAASPAPPAPPAAFRHDNLTLYLDQDDSEGRR
jgi:hypothetical protein